MGWLPTFVAWEARANVPAFWPARLGRPVTNGAMPPASANREPSAAVNGRESPPRKSHQFDRTRPPPGGFHGRAGRWHTSSRGGRRSWAAARACPLGSLPRSPERRRRGSGFPFARPCGRPYSSGPSQSQVKRKSGRSHREASAARPRRFHRRGDTSRKPWAGGHPRARIGVFRGTSCTSPRCHPGCATLLAARARSSDQAARRPDVSPSRVWLGRAHFSRTLLPPAGDIRRNPWG